MKEVKGILVQPSFRKLAESMCKEMGYTDVTIRTVSNLHEPMITYDDIEHMNEVHKRCQERSMTQ